MSDQQEPQAQVPIPASTTVERNPPEHDRERRKPKKPTIATTKAPRTLTLTGADIKGVVFKDDGGSVRFATRLPRNSRYATVLREGDTIAAVNGELTSGRVNFLVIQQLQVLAMSPRSRFTIDVEVPADLQQKLFVATPQDAPEVGELLSHVWSYGRTIE